MQTFFILLAALATPAAAQDAERVFTPGEIVRTGGTQTIKILRCRLEKVSRETECEFVEWKNGGAVSAKNWMLASQLANAEARVKEREELDAMADQPTPAPQ